MKLFMKEQIPLIIVQCLQFLMVLLIFWLSGYHNVRIMMYALFIGFFFLGCYLTYTYITRRHFYQKLQTPLQSLDESLERTDFVPIAKALDQLLKVQYQLYQERIFTIEDKKEEHLRFMDRWVHQMKTPLSVIELTAQNLDEPESSSIREETNRIQTGLNTVLYMARLRTIEKDFHIKPIHLEQLIHEVNKDQKRFYIRNNVYPTLEVDPKADEIIVESDEKWLFFIVTQLIHNAVKYTLGHSRQIILSVYERAGSAVLSVQDFGMGIPEEDERRIFDAFYTGENGRRVRESTGMGLYLVKEAVEYLGHTIEMESELGKGTTFRIVFPPTQNLT
ncbi:MAG TPA: sensor histidine kinase [Bacillota bacterium]